MVPVCVQAPTCHPPTSCRPRSSRSWNARAPSSLTRAGTTTSSALSGDSRAVHAAPHADLARRGRRRRAGPVGVAVALALQDNDEPSLSEPEQRLVSSITGAAPAPDACGPRSSTAPEADASVNCDPAAHVVTEYHQFPTPEAAQRWFDQAGSALTARATAPGTLRRAVRAPTASQFCDDQAGGPHLFYLDEAARIGVEAHVNTSRAARRSTCCSPSGRAPGSSSNNGVLTKARTQP